MPPPPTLPIERALGHLGAKISRARRRRRLSQADMAEQIGASESTIRRLEKGESGIALQHLIGVFCALGELGSFNALLDTPNDAIGLMLQDEQLPQRIRRRASEKV
ncbi:helix-turn-helix domain-containing protein [Hydrogenophaga sp. OTU3427]|uniref:helix-turn-helix domain-containing protein n=1 Tax=Hydrogenophaga sp. OTU3427 TaxID=3043856 RepID=UPI00313F19B1